MKTALEAVKELQEAFDEAGLARPVTPGHAELTGWTEKMGQAGGYTVRKREDGSLSWRVTICAKSLLRYEETKALRGDEVITIHAPVCPEGAGAKLRPACEKLGLDVFSIKHLGHATFGCHDVVYEISTTHPDWLEPYRLQRRPKYGQAGILY